MLRYVLTTVLAWGAYLVASVVLLLIVYGITGNLSIEKMPQNWLLVVAMLPFAFLIFGLWLGVRFVHGRPFRTLFTPPAARFRWRSLFLSAAIWFGLSAISDLFVSGMMPGNYQWSFEPAKFFPFLILSLVLIPIQISGEELYFRAYLTQGVGLFSKGGLVLPLLLPSIVFTALHSQNPEVGAYGLIWEMLNVGIMALVLAGITLRSQGMELALGLHAANNLYSALMVTFPSSAISSPALFSIQTLDPKLGVISLLIMSSIYLLLLSAWKRGSVWRLALLAVLLLSACVPAAPQPEKPLVPVVSLKDCRLASPGFPVQYAARCGELQVYENREAQTGRKIAIHFAVVPAASQNVEPDPLFLLAGGPGQAATEAFVPMISALSRVGFKRDLVLVDQRGTGHSHALRCPKPANTEDGLDQDQSREQQLANLDTCVKSLDADARFYTTDVAMQDLDDVRQALGYQTINLLGVSYGTRAAQTYLRLFPQHTRALILDGVVPIGWALGENIAIDAQRALDLTGERCQAEPACRAAFPQPAKELSDLLAQVEKSPVEVELAHPTTGEPTKVRLTRNAIAVTVRLMLYATEYTALVPLVIHQAAGGDYKLLAAQYLMVTQSLSESMSDGMYLSVICSEDAPFLSGKQLDGTLFYQFDMKDLKTQCERWPHEVVPEGAREPVKSQTPTLLLSGQADPVTPPANASQVATYLTNSREIVTRGLGHNVMYRGCLPKVIADFLESGKLDGLATDCVDKIEPQPFFLNYTGPKP